MYQSVKMDTSETYQSQFASRKVEEIIDFIYDDYSDIILEHDPSFFVNHADRIPRLDKSSTKGVQVFNQEVIVKFLCVHIAVLEEQLSKIDGGHKGCFYIRSEKPKQ